MSTALNNLFNFNRTPLPPPFGGITNKRIPVASKYGDGKQATLCCTVIKALNAVCACMNGSGAGAVGVIDHRLQSDSFDFEEQRLADALTSLPDQKRQILTMLYVLEMKPEEIAAKLNCTIQNVYNQRSLTLKRLRAVLGGGEGHE